MDNDGIEFKLVIELDDEKLARDNWDVEDTYRIVRGVFDNKDLHLVPDDSGKLIYISYRGAKAAYGAIGVGGVKLYDSWLNPYIKRMEWHNLTEDTVEDIFDSLSEDKPAEKADVEDKKDVVEFKLVIELDDEKLARDNWDVEDTYRIVRGIFDKNADLHPVDSDKGEIVYISYYGAKEGYSGIGGGGIRLYDSWLNPYIKRMEWHNLIEGTMEDCIKILDSENNR